MAFFNCFGGRTTSRNLEGIYFEGNKKESTPWSGKPPADNSYEFSQIS